MPTATEDGGTIHIRADGTEIARYRTDGRTKPYFEALALPAAADRYAGRNLLSDSPHDHVWHHGAWFVQKIVDGLNCWESELAEADDRPHGIGVDTGTSVSDTDDGVTIEQAVDWRASYGESLLEDERRITVHEPDDGGYLVAWHQELTAVGDTRNLHSESYHGRYGGLSLRFARELTGGDIRLPEATNPDPNDTVTGPWCDFTGDLDGAPRVSDIRQAGITVFDHPANERPSTYFTRREPFALLTANPIWADIVVLDPGESLTADWGLWVHERTPSAEALDEAYSAYVDLADAG